MKNKQIRLVKNWLKLRSIKDIQIFIGFANFYPRFMQNFSKIFILFSFLLKITRLSEKLAPKTFKADVNEVVNSDSGRTNEIVMNLSKNNKFRKLTYMPNIKATKKLIFLILNAKKIFNHLWLAFIKVPIFQYFNLENYI